MKDEKLRYSPFFAGTLCALILFVTQFALHPINMSGGMTLVFPLVSLVVNIPLVAIFCILLLTVVLKSKKMAVLIWILGVATILMLVIIIYFFFSTGVLEAKNAKPDLDRFYPQDESHFWYAGAVWMYLVFLFLSLKLRFAKLTINPSS